MGVYVKINVFIFSHWALGLIDTQHFLADLKCETGREDTTIIK